jgi:Spy/CpxP family protein refolding chaperone
MLQVLVTDWNPVPSFKVKPNGGASKEQNIRRNERNDSSLMMNITKQTLIALVATAGALCWHNAAFAAAQGPGRFGGARAAQWRERMQDAAKDLDLTEEQRAKLKEFYAPQREKLRAIWQDQNLTREQKLEKFKALRVESQPKLKDILTPEQFEKWQQRQTEARERMAAAKKDWNITEDQKAKLKAILQPQAEKFRELRQDKDLTPREKMEKFRAMREELAPQIKEVLTPEQYEKWEKTRGEMMEKTRERWQQRKQQ